MKRRINIWPTAYVHGIAGGGGVGGVRDTVRSVREIRVRDTVRSVREIRVSSSQFLRCYVRYYVGHILEGAHINIESVCAHQSRLAPCPRGPEVNRGVGE